MITLFSAATTTTTTIIIIITITTAAIAVVLELHSITKTYRGHDSRADRRSTSGARDRVMADAPGKSRDDLRW